jgi:hypothetical protein
VSRAKPVREHAPENAPRKIASMKKIYTFVEVELAKPGGTPWDLRFFATRKEAEDYGLQKAKNALTFTIIGESEVSEKEASNFLAASKRGEA